MTLGRFWGILINARSNKTKNNMENNNQFTILSPSGEFINTADSEKEAFKLLGARNKRDREVLIKAGFKVTPSIMKVEGVDLGEIPTETV